MKENLKDRYITIRTIAYHGEPYKLAGVPTRDSVIVNTNLPLQQVFNDPFSGLTIDVVMGEMSTHDIDELVADFQREYHCKVNYVECEENIREFDIFEPSWKSVVEASCMVNTLNKRLTDFSVGHPTGR